jgi:hypothetical protein
MDVLLACLPQLQVLYIEDFIGLFEFFLVFFIVLRVVGLRILMFFMWSHKG